MTQTFFPVEPAGYYVADFESVVVQVDTEHRQVLVHTDAGSIEADWLSALKALRSLGIAELSGPVYDRGVDAWSADF